MQIDLLPRHLSLRYPMEVNLWGDARRRWRRCSRYLQAQDDLQWQTGIAENMRSWDTTLERAAHAKADPVNPRLVFHTLNERLPAQRHRDSRRGDDGRLVRQPHPARPRA